MQGLGAAAVKAVTSLRNTLESLMATATDSNVADLVDAGSFVEYGPLLLAALNAPGLTTIIEPTATRDHTERMLRSRGIAA